jgi:hypothetical protein
MKIPTTYTTHNLSDNYLKRISGADNIIVTGTWHHTANGLLVTP